LLVKLLNMGEKGRSQGETWVVCPFISGLKNRGVRKKEKRLSAGGSFTRVRARDLREEKA